MLADGRHDLPAMAAAVDDTTRAVFLCTPNNPTGPVLTADDVAGFLAVVPPDVLVVLDEAYHEFVTEPAAVDGVAVAGSRPNVVALRTLSKAYGLAGLRVGYAVGHPEVIGRIRAVGVPFGVSRVAEAAVAMSASFWASRSNCHLARLRKKAVSASMAATNTQNCQRRAGRKGARLRPIA